VNEDYMIDEGHLEPYDIDPALLGHRKMGTGKDGFRIEELTMAF